MKLIFQIGSFKSTMILKLRQTHAVCRHCSEEHEYGLNKGNFRNWVFQMLNEDKIVSEATDMNTLV